MGWHKVTTVDEIPEDEVRGFYIEGTQIGISNVEGEYFCFENICTHAYALLSDGFLDGDKIECPLHQGLFCVRDGKAVDGPVDVDLRTFPLKIENDEIFVEI